MTEAQVIDGAAHFADESEAEMRLLTHVVSSAASFHGSLAQEQIDELLGRASSPALPSLPDQPIQN